jgi:hypothetical protein
MSEDLKMVIDALIYEGEWKALYVIASTMGGAVNTYICEHPDCPWYGN